MICIFHGDDAYSIKEALESLRARGDGQDLQGTNTTRFAAQEVTPSLLVSACSTVPFLAERRLVIVEGLLTSLESPDQSMRRGPGREQQDKERRGGLLNQWRGLATALQQIAPTTDLIFLEGPLRRNNPLLRELESVAQSREFRPLAGGELERWILQRSTAITPEATRLLAELIGPDLWTQSNEIEKLSLYCHGRRIRAEDVEALVSPAREASIFAAVDAVLERSSKRALYLLSRLLESGATVPYILSMLARQVRLALLAQELIRERVPSAEIGPRLGITLAYPLRKTLEHARRSPSQGLRRLHRMLLEAEVAIKGGALRERLALEVLVARICYEEPLGAQQSLSR